MQGVSEVKQQIFDEFIAELDLSNMSRLERKRFLQVASEQPERGDQKLKMHTNRTWRRLVASLPNPSDEPSSEKIENHIMRLIMHKSMCELAMNWIIVRREIKGIVLKQLLATHLKVGLAVGDYPR